MLAWACDAILLFVASPFEAAAVSQPLPFGFRRVEDIVIEALNREGSLVMKVKLAIGSSCVEGLMEVPSLISCGSHWVNFF